MAENKKSFLLYADYLHTFNELTDEEAGKLVKCLFEYVNDLNPIIEDRFIKIAFEPIKRQLKRDLKEWDLTVIDRSNNGKLGNIKRWHKDLYDKIVREEISLDQALVIANDRKVSPPDSTQSDTIANVAVTVNDTVTVTVNEDLYKRGDQFPKADLDLNIPEDDKSNMIKVYNTRKGITITNKQVDKMWEVFKLQKLDGKTFYETPAEIIKHFKNWLPLQKIEVNPEPIKEQSRDELLKHAQALANRYQ